MPIRVRQTIIRELGPAGPAERRALLSNALESVRWCMNHPPKNRDLTDLTRGGYLELLRQAVGLLSQAHDEDDR